MSDLIHFTHGNEDSEEEIIQALIKYLENLSENSTPESKIYFSGAESAPTTFENLSNHLEIGVISNSEYVALILLRFVRIIVDEYYDILWADLEEIPSTQHGYAKVSEIAEILSKPERCCLMSFYPNQKFTRKLWGERGEYTVSKRIHEVDVWTLPRVKKVLEELY